LARPLDIPHPLGARFAKPLRRLRPLAGARAKLKILQLSLGHERKGLGPDVRSTFLCQHGKLALNFKLERLNDGCAAPTLSGACTSAGEGLRNSMFTKCR
jgi:hypothetical protein